MVGTVIIENPHNGNNLSYNQLCEEVRCLMGVTSSNIKLFQKEAEVSQTNVNSMLGKTLTTCPSTSARYDAIAGVACPFIDVKFKNKIGTLLLENPVGCEVTSYVNEVLSTLFEVPLNSTKNIKAGKDTFEIKSMTTAQWKKLCGKSVDLVL